MDHKDVTFKGKDYSDLPIVQRFGVTKARALLKARGAAVKNYKEALRLDFEPSPTPSHRTIVTAALVAARVDLVRALLEINPDRDICDAAREIADLRADFFAALP